MAQAAAKHGIEPRSVSFKGAIQTLEAFQPVITRLEYLNLAGADITDGAVQFVTTLTGLKHLDLRRTHITQVGLGQLRCALPKCEIRDSFTVTANLQSP